MNDECRLCECGVVSALCSAGASHGSNQRPDRTDDAHLLYPATTTNMAPPSPIELAPPPWTCKCSMYWLMFSLSSPLPEDIYAPLEAESSTFADPQQTGQFRGGLGNIQVVRYSSTPADSYDELLLIPGAFDVPNTKDKCNRITRIYVSQEKTCYNGRKNWGIPKHLARFSFSTPPTTASSSAQALKVEVFPPDPAVSKPFFSAVLQPFQYLPAVPFTTKIMPYLGLDARLAQPPLPASTKPGAEALTSSAHFYRMAPSLYAARVKGMWVDVKTAQKKSLDEAQENDDVSGVPQSSWWPDVTPWKIGLWLEDATLEFGEPEVLD